ncbi:hypothetical protein D5086_018574 [Populus alba]|uniref:Uncharacterized protein n=1 Tax=Populus alba TaxID=43335 RepID=A0ACC4BQ62_POPAL
MARRVHMAYLKADDSISNALKETAVHHQVKATYSEKIGFGFLKSELPYFSSGDSQLFGCFAILGIIGGPIATKAHMALLKAIYQIAYIYWMLYKTGGRTLEFVE